MLKKAKGSGFGRLVLRISSVPPHQNTHFRLLTKLILYGELENPPDSGLVQMISDVTWAESGRQILQSLFPQLQCLNLIISLHEQTHFF